MKETFIARAFRTVCLLELQALKPGNVHVYAAGHGMTVENFMQSANAAAPFIAEPGASVGTRILKAVEATIATVGLNTNLGIILLAAPLASAAELSDQPFQQALGVTLNRLSIEDARLAFSAIRAANPAGLGTIKENDIHEPSRVTLLEAMRQAADRDLVARQYATNYRDVLELGLQALGATKRDWNDPWAATSLYLTFLAKFPDSHIVRKYGAAVAAEVTDRTRTFTTQHTIGPEFEADLLKFDAELKTARLNPGTSADMTVATLFVAALQEAAVPRIRV